MPLPELLAGLAEYIGDDPTKAKEVARALRDTKSEHAEPLNALAQTLIDVGAGKKKGEAQRDVEAKQAEIDRLTEALETATEAAESAQKKPNELQADFDKRRLKLEEKAQKLEADLLAERQGRTQDRVGYAASPVLSHLRSAVDPDYLDEVLAPRVARRIRPAATGQGVEYLDEHETPYDGDEKAQARALAEDTLKGVPDKYRVRQMNPGGGAAGGGSQGAVTVEQLEAEKRNSRAYGARF